MPENLNTNEYWEKRFEGNWEQRGGRMQTTYFAETALTLMPDWLRQELSANPYSFCDAGCGMGDSYGVFSKVFLNLRYFGFDFAQAAVDSANERYPRAEFKVNDLFNLDTSETYDVVFCSNVLEHFDQPLQIMQNLFELAEKYLMVMVPFREDFEEAEHVVRFTPRNIPLAVGGGFLVHAASVQCEERWLYKGRQILLVYAKGGHLKDVHYLSGVIEDVSNDSMETMEGRIQRVRHEKEMSDQRWQELNSQFYNYKLNAENEAIIVGREHKTLLDSLQQQLEQSRSDLEQKRKDFNALDIVYKDLYHHSSNLEKEVERLNNSWSLRLGYALLWPARIVVRVIKKLGRMLKYLLAWDMKGLKFELVEPFARRIRPLITRARKRKALEAIEGDIRGKNVLILPPTLDWNMPLFQRPQQLAMAYSRRPDTVVVYLSPGFNETILTGFKAEDSLWVLNSGLYQDLIPYLDAASRKILSISWTINKPYSDSLPGAHLIYEYIDELEIFMNYDEQMEIDHAVMAQRADVTVCTASKLYEQVKDKARNPLLSTNGGDYDLFATTRNTAPHPEMATLQRRFEKVMGYYGALAKWFDYDTVREVARLKPGWCWALVGMDYDETLQKSGILDLPNVHYLGPQDYKTLPRFLTAFDVATIPFAINEITLSTSPVKLFEYMAGGKPILTSDLPECRKYESVLRYKSAEEFIELAEKLMALPEDDPYWQALEREAKANTWDAKVQEILDNLLPD